MSFSSLPARRVPAVIGALYLAVALYVLAFGFPAEDAFILFRFAANVARGYGVVYSPGGPHAEGATDFLWMLALAGARVGGVDIAVAAAILNALGCAACAALFLRGGPARVSWPEALALVWLLLSPPAMAGYVGFGTMPFCALALWTALASVEGRPGAVVRVPLAGLVPTLPRPDGAFLAIGFGVLAALRARRLAIVRRFAVAALVAAILGALYFVWRAHYFHEWLPLPMYVKRHYAGHPGVGQTIDWFISIVPTLLFALAALVASNRGPTRDERALLVVLVPFLVHTLSFLPTTQTQNIANRFQAPATLALMCIAFRFLRARQGELAVSGRAPAAIGAAIALLPGLLAVPKVLLDALRPDYLEVFAPELARLTDRDGRIALTEAGNIPYWTDAPVLDLVGLNSPETARLPPTREMLERFAPDVVMLHPADALDIPCLMAHVDDDGASVARAERPLRGCVTAARAPFLSRTLPRYRDLHAQNIFVAPVVALDFLDAHAEYDVYVVRARTAGGVHVYGFRRGWGGEAAAVRALEESHHVRGASYLAEHAASISAISARRDHLHPRTM